MDFKDISQYLLAKPCAEQDMPFGPDVVVFRVKGKMFALVLWNKNPLRINLKCDPQQALFLRDSYDAVIPGYHMNKKHWNTVILDNSIERREVFRMVDSSYELVVKGLNKADRRALALAGYPERITSPDDKCGTIIDK